MGERSVGVGVEVGQTHADMGAAPEATGRALGQRAPGQQGQCTTDAEAQVGDFFMVIPCACVDFSEGVLRSVSCRV